ncbi:MAG: glycosyltransferase involved in cell wall biosynthesis [Alteromonadaceae bacterium]|jgi:glycosyltransferase involved in cell wall biosynthesis
MGRNRSNNILFVYTDFKIGGIQTQILEMCKHNNGEKNRGKVLILTEEYDLKLLSELRKFSDVWFLQDLLLDTTLNKNLLKLSNLFSPMCRYNKEAVSSLLHNIDACHVTNLFTFYFISSLLLKKTIEPLKVTLGFYHANEAVALSNDVAFYKSILNKIKFLSPSSIISTSTQTTKNISFIFDDAKKSKNIIEATLGVPREATFKNKDKNEVLSVLSIGRLIPFKTYNLHILELVNNLKEEGCILHYTIIGDGPDYTKIYKYIDDKKLASQVTLIKHVDYSELDAYIDSADVFIGSGTSLTLAAGRSCVSIIGIESNSLSNTYGYLSNTKGCNYHELGLDYPLPTFKECILDLIAMNSETFNKIRYKNYQRSNDFSVTAFMKTFNQMNVSADIYSGFRFTSYLSILSNLIQSLIVDKGIKKTNISKKY